MSYRQRVLDRARRYLAGSCHDKPMAAGGLTSYRYPGRYGWIMIGAKDRQHAINEANRSLSGGVANLATLEVWDAAQGKYMKVCGGANG